MPKILSVKLNSGFSLPTLGLGTYKSAPGSETENAVKWALVAGYRLIDTAAYYGNEGSVGKAVRESSIPRHEIFITTKLWNSDHAIVEKAFEGSLSLLNSGYIDLYLIHWPIVRVRVQTWKRMEKLIAGGKIKSIGVANFMIRHLEDLLANTEIIPAVNQVEFSPYVYNKELLDYCKKKGIQLQAYSPLTRGNKLSDEKLLALSKKYSKSPAQILLRWCIQHDVAVIPKSVHEGRIIENSQIFDFELSKQDMDLMDSWNEGFRVAPDPNQYR
ncbi:MAG: aldo/keto reductase [Candidatus Micrarchaeota archaeon]